VILEVKVGLFLNQTELLLRKFFSIFSKKLIDAMEITQAITPPTYIGSRRLKLAMSTPKSTAIDIPGRIELC
jgi:hypothetical protein